ncbi:uncharacterized protein DS421_20g679010 [Arachis hypogaea]|nr:uncharacterized protein DS421_20g679010 [Arachis hypogaea]
MLGGVTGSVETDAIDILRLLTLGRLWMIFRKVSCVFIKFVWVAYAVDRVDPDIIPADIYMHPVVWSATVSLMSFECIEWHATDRYRRQFGFVQGVPHQERNLDKHPLDTYMYWYRTKFGDCWNLSNIVIQENDEGNQVMDDDNQEQEPQSPPPPHPPPNPLPQEQPQSSSQYVPETQFTPIIPNTSAVLGTITIWPSIGVHDG